MQNRAFLLVSSIAAGLFLSLHTVRAELPADREEAVRLQVFLDRANFGPGKIDGRYGDFTLKALALYRQSQGEQPAAGSGEAAKGGAKPDLKGLNLSSADPVFITYTVTEDDLKNVGEVPESVAAQAKLKGLPYKTAAEGVAEKFHCDADFLAELNPGKVETIKAGDTLSVPNVQPFELAALQAAKAGENEESSKPESEDEKPKTPASVVTVKVDTKANMVTVWKDDKLTAAYPVTIGSGQTESPVGDWKVRGTEKMPEFRYDEAMLQRGERSDDFHMLPPGPNNPVGVLWIALNKKGIGLHGTSEPDQIGRSSSHGCVRLANWDVVRLAEDVKPGVAVSIH